MVTYLKIFNAPKFFVEYYEFARKAKQFYNWLNSYLSITQQTTG